MDYPIFHFFIILIVFKGVADEVFIYFFDGNLTHTS